ncbi:hypothetical protein [Alteromonas sp.]|jgi:hypothetical protein|uniref:hypothetical protein n=1 Tax=Alteromonas sp. TaxID=232 RepID=UPI00257A32B8|nr:hypothetical protein [Alteromonas sp.]NQY16633.1 hypothetical protein [Alteromonas sp.]
MDDSNQHLKHLLKQTDLAFKALMREPASSLLNEQYEKAKLELDTYTASLKHTLNQRQHQRQHQRQR